MGGGNSHTETVTKQDNTPWAPAQAPLIDIYGQAKTAYDATPKTAYSGSYIAPQSQSTILAQMMGQQLAQRSQGQGDKIAANSSNIFNSFMPALTNAANSAGTGKGLGTAEDYTNYIKTAGGNTVLQDAIRGSTDPILQNLQEKIIPQAKLNASGSGTYGGDASSIAMSQAINDNYTRDATNAASQLTFNAADNYFNRNLQAQGQLPGLVQAAGGLQDMFTKGITDAYQVNALPIDTLSQIGNSQDQYAQDTVKALYQQWQDQINAPFQGLEQYRGAISGYPTSSSGSSSGNTSGGGGLF